MMSHEESRMLAHAFAGWIRTVRGDELRYGRSTAGCIENGTVHREFWHPGQKKPQKDALTRLVQRRYLFRNHMNVSVGITAKGVEAVKRSPEFDLVKREFSEQDIQDAIDALPTTQVDRTVGSRR